MQNAASSDRIATTPRIETLAGLREEFRRRGYYEPPVFRVLLEFVFHLTLLLAGLWLIIVPDHLALRLAGCLISTMGFLGTSTHAHTSSHGASAKQRWLNNVLGFIGYPFLAQLSCTYWYHKHVVVHHPAPNVIGTDADIDLMPVFAMTHDEYNKSRGLMRMWFRIQWLFFPIFLPFNAFNVQRVGWTFLFKQLANKKRRQWTHWADLTCLVLHVLVWIALPMIWFAPLDVMLLYLLRTALVGYAMFIAFAPAHFPEEATCVTTANPKADFALIQCTNTVNFKTGPLGRLLCSGVDYQIEHHLFPSICHVYYPKMAPLVAEYCKANGYPYRVLPWPLAIWKSLTILNGRKEIYEGIDELKRFHGVSQAATESSVEP